MRPIGNTFLGSRRIIGASLALRHISSAGGGHHSSPGPVIAIYPPLTLAPVHKWQPLSDGRLL
jgi:hypothetical protein